MPVFSQRSIDRLYTCDPRLIKVMERAILSYDFTVLEGYRDKAAQNEAYRTGKSKLQYPDSKHNKTPSLAVDVAPWPIDWNDYKRFYYLGGLVMGVASQMGIPLRWGGDWDSDGVFSDQTFNDLPHFELI